jgi:hypothetical protein
MIPAYVFLFLLLSLWKRKRKFDLNSGVMSCRRTFERAVRGAGEVGVGDQGLLRTILEGF